MRGIHKDGFWRTDRTAKGVPLTTSLGMRNSTRIAEYEGLAGNRKEVSWSKVEHKHTCCGALVSWRHKIGCPNKQGASNA